MITGPKLETRSDQPYAAIRTQVAMSELPRVIPELHREVAGWLRRKGVAPTGPPFIRYLVINMARKLDIELGWPIAKTVPGDSRVTSGILLAGRYASLVYKGDYSGLMGANAALLDWGEKEGLAWDSREEEKGDTFGGRFESYLTDPMSEPDPAKWETEVAIRVAG